MELNDRIAQLAEFGVSYDSRPLQETDKSFEGCIAARFGGAGLEYILPHEERNPRVVTEVIEDDGIYRVLQAEVGDERAIRLFNLSTQIGIGSGAIIESETHVILDFQSGMRLTFEMPSRKYLNPSFDGPYSLNRK